MGVLMEYANFFAITFNLKNNLRNNGRGGKPKMSKFIVRGGNRLTGSVKVSGAKIPYYRS